MKIFIIKLIRAHIDPIYEFWSFRNCLHYFCWVVAESVLKSCVIYAFHTVLQELNFWMQTENSDFNKYFVMSRRNFKNQQHLKQTQISTPFWTWFWVALCCGSWYLPEMILRHKNATTLLETQKITFVRNMQQAITEMVSELLIPKITAWQAHSERSVSPDLVQQYISSKNRSHLHWFYIMMYQPCMKQEKIPSPKNCKGIDFRKVLAKAQ